MSSKSVTDLITEAQQDDLRLKNNEDNKAWITTKGSTALAGIGSNPTGVRPPDSDNSSIDEKDPPEANNDCTLIIENATNLMYSVVEAVTGTIEQIVGIQSPETNEKKAPSSNARRKILQAPFSSLSITSLQFRGLYTSDPPILWIFPHQLRVLEL
ncbi:hypothetical protein G9A89_013500 [Geosiphon pyriformis]|nr:hypothetical protein G9A89_013500 [Geosiphon pyriformis]